MSNKVGNAGRHSVILAVPRSVSVRSPVVGQRHGIRIIAEALTHVPQGAADFYRRSRDTAVRGPKVESPLRNVWRCVSRERVKVGRSHERGIGKCGIGGDSPLLGCLYRSSQFYAPGFPAADARRTVQPDSLQNVVALDLVVGERRFGSTIEKHGLQSDFELIRLC